MFSRAQGKPVLIADVEAGSVGVAIAIQSNSSPLRIVALRRTVFPQEQRTPDQLSAFVINELGKTADAVLASFRATHQHDFGPVQGVVVAIRAPWTRSNTVRVSKRFPKDTGITHELINTTAAEALDEEKDLDHTKLIETSIVRVELNGYPTAHPVGKSAHTIAISVLMGECDTAMREGIVHELQRVSSLRDITVRSGTQAVLSFLRHNNHLPHDCLVMDMSGEATNMIVIRKGVSVGHEMVSEGVRSIVARCSNGLPEEAMGLIRMATRDQCNDSTCDSVIASMAKVEPDLVRLFGEALSKLSAQRRIPNKCVLIVDQDVAPWLTQFFARIDFAQFTTTMSPFLVVGLSPQGVDKALAYDPGVSTDPGLSVVASLAQA